VQRAYDGAVPVFTRARVVGRGRVGAAFAARLADRGVLASGDEADLVILCVPDGAIGDVARGIAAGPWVAHVSGATPLAVLAPHTRRFSLHPLQTFTHGRGADQIDGAWGALTAETPEAHAAGLALANTLGLRPFDLADDRRTLYHTGAVFASNYLVTLHRAAVRALGAAGAPPEALLPLMRRTIDNGFDLTGPIARGDWAVVHAHLAALGRELPDLEALYRALAQATTP
jgi:predicted short-subunit dehydrogenase-like oxidoreductase (DUF2520 family)